MPQFAASRVLPATCDEVWAVLAEPDRLADWWPGIDGVEPTVRRALAPGALWRIEGGGTGKPSFRRRPQMVGNLLVIDVEPPTHLSFQLLAERIDADLTLEQNEDDQAAATLVVDAPRFAGVGRAFPSDALAALASLVRTDDPT